MLVLTRHLNECIDVDAGRLGIKVLGIRGNTVKLGFEGPARVRRGELLEPPRRTAKGSEDEYDDAN